MRGYPTPQEQAIFPKAHYDALLTAVASIGAKTALEFGPGISTFALIGAGCTLIDTCEHDYKWYLKSLETFKDHPQVTIHKYQDTPEVYIPALTNATYDVAFVDSPPGMGKRQIFHTGQENCARYNTLMYALARAPIVFLDDSDRPGERETLRRVEALGHSVSYIPTPKGTARIDRRG